LPDDPGPKRTALLWYLNDSRLSSQVEWMIVLDMKCACHAQKHNGGPIFCLCALRVETHSRFHQRREVRRDRGSQALEGITAFEH
jgi:hypothetical protein